MRGFGFGNARNESKIHWLHTLAAIQAQLKHLASGEQERFEILHRRWKILSSQVEWLECQSLAVDMIAEIREVACGCVFIVRDHNSLRA